MMKLTRWGSSTGLRLPAEIALEAGLSPGDYVHVRLLNSGDIRVRPAKSPQPADPPDDEDATREGATPVKVATW